jgi:hypothetical protein
MVFLDSPSSSQSASQKASSAAAFAPPKRAFAPLRPAA